MIEVTIIIVNYNTLNLTKQCLDSIFEHTKGINYQIIVVDNNSTDDSFNVLKKLYTNIEIIPNDANLGFGRANNVGLKEAKGKYILFLNSDTLLLNNSIKLFYDFFETHEFSSNIGALGCVMLDKELAPNYRNSYYHFPTLKSYFKSILSNFFKFLRNSYNYDKLELDKNQFLPVDFIVGADLFVPRNVLNVIGDFDPDYFLYWEEVDLQFRMKKQNLKRLIIKGPKIIHLEGSSSVKEMSNWKRITETQSLLIFLKKHSTFLKLQQFKIILILFGAFSFFRNRHSFFEQRDYLNMIYKFK
jgi:GT2 family glycosyltransferase